MTNGKLGKLREMGSKPVRIVPTNFPYDPENSCDCSRTHGYRLFIGDDEFPYPIERGSVSVSPATMRSNRLTLTLFVGEVTFETKPHVDGVTFKDAED